MIIGEPEEFAMEFEISEVYPFGSFKAVGKLLVYVAGVSYGVDDPWATYLGFPQGFVQDRIGRRGTHTAKFASSWSAEKIVSTFLDSEYSANCYTPEGRAISKAINFLRLDWSADGDAAFDDGSHIYQFDLGDDVRIVACKNNDDREISEVVISADAFYGILDEWQRELEAQWRRMVQALDES